MSPRHKGPPHEPSPPLLLPAAGEPVCLLSPLALAEPQLARVNGVDIAWSETGSGEPLVLIHGFGDCASVWTAFLPGLSQHYRVITLELRGHGRSGEFGGAFRFEETVLRFLAEPLR